MAAGCPGDNPQANLGRREKSPSHFMCAQSRQLLLGCLLMRCSSTTADECATCAPTLLHSKGSVYDRSPLLTHICRVAQSASLVHLGSLVVQIRAFQAAAAHLVAHALQLCHHRQSAACIDRLLNLTLGHCHSFICMTSTSCADDALNMHARSRQLA